MAEKNNKKHERMNCYYNFQLSKFSDILSKKSNLYYISLMVLSVITLVIAWLRESNTFGVVDNAFDSINEKFIILIGISLAFIALLYVLPDYLAIYRRYKKRRFSGICGGIIAQSYYRLSCIYMKSGDVLYSEYLANKDIDKDFIKTMSASKTISNRTSKVIYDLLIIFIGSLLVLGKTNIILYIISIISFIVVALWVLMVLYYDRFKAKYLIIIAKITKFLYKYKIIKDYEKVYNILVSKLMYYGSALRFDKVYFLISIICGVIAKFLKHLMLFFIVSMFNIVDVKLLIEVLLKCVILDLIIDMLPLSNGIVVYELIFLTMFRSVFFEGYVIYGLVIYRFITYFIVGVLFYIGSLCGIRKNLTKVKSNIDSQLTN